MAVPKLNVYILAKNIWTPAERVTRRKTTEYRAVPVESVSVSRSHQAKVIPSVYYCDVGKSEEIYNKRIYNT